MIAVNTMPNANPPNLEAIPAELKQLSQWVMWKYVFRKGKWTKSPHSTGTNGNFSGAKADDPKSWLPFSGAVDRYQQHGFDGVGFEFHPDGPHFGIDLDDCRDPDKGEIESGALGIVQRFGTYAEISPSGTGIKLIGRGRLALPPDKKGKPRTGKRRKIEWVPGKLGEIECYDRGRYFAITGNVLPGFTAITDCSVVLQPWFHELFPDAAKTSKPTETEGEEAAEETSQPQDANSGLSDDDLIRIACRAKNGHKFVRLWDGDVDGYSSPSEADQALCNLLAFYTGPDAARVDRLFRQSKLYREKWEREDYRDETIAKALKRTTFYTPQSATANDDSPETAEETEGRDSGATCRNSDLGNGRLCVAIFGEEMRWCHPWKKGMVWQGSHFSIDNNGGWRRFGQETADFLYRRSLIDPLADEKDRKYAASCSSSTRISAMLTEASVQPGIAVLPSQMDADPWLLNCPNGTVDLRTGKLRPHRRDDLITKLCPTNYNPEAASDEWDKFVEGIFGGRQPLLDFIQRFFGYCLTGVITEELLPIFWGSGANGKTTLLKAVMEALGTDYAMKAVKDLLMVKSSESHPTERADLFGKRFVACVESGQDRKLDETLVKELTGREKIRARRMKEDFWEFEPSHKAILCTNHKPKINGTDHGIWRRIALVPFTATYWDPDKGESGPPELRQDKGLQDKLRAEAEGILAWCVRGCLDWQRHGLKIPDEVRSATAQYRSAEDLMAMFVTECCFASQGVKEKASNLYGAFSKWCEVTGEKKTTQRVFGEQLAERGFESFTSNGTWYRGIALKADNVGEIGNEN